MKKINLINIITFLFIVFALFIISCEESGGTSSDTGGGDTVCQATDRDTLVKCIEDAMIAQNDGITPDLNNIKLGAGLTGLQHFFSRANSPLNKNSGTTGFDRTKFNGDISKWDTSNITDMELMFSDARSFNQPIGNWNTSKVTNMSGMFFYAENFNQDINTKEVTVDGTSYKAWDVSKVENMSYMFNFALAFDQPIGNWNTSNVTTMANMFIAAAETPAKFNQDISTREVTIGGTSYKAWDVGKVRNMSNMFNAAVDFNRDLTSWTWVENPLPATGAAAGPNYAINVTNMFTGATSMPVAKFPKICAEATAPYPSAGGEGGYVQSSCL